MDTTHKLYSFTGLECLCSSCLESLLNRAGGTTIHPWLYLLAARENYNRRQEKLLQSSFSDNLEQVDIAVLSNIAKNIDGQFELNEQIAAVEELLQRFRTVEFILAEYQQS
jgi:hypothetical protein